MSKPETAPVRVADHPGQPCRDGRSHIRKRPDWRPAAQVAAAERISITGHGTHTV